MKILIIPSWYKDEENPVLGSFFEEQARSLMSMGHMVGVLYPKFFAFSSNMKSQINQTVDNDLPTWYVKYKAQIPKNYALNYKLFQLKVYRVYKEYVIKYGKPDIIHAHTVFYGGIAALFIAKKENIPFVTTEHYTPFITGGITHKTDWKIANEVFTKSQCNIVVSYGFKDLLVEKLKVDKNIFDVIPNMVQQDFFENEIKTNFDSNAPHFFTVSFLTERKNVHLMIDSFALLVKKTPNAIFEIGGDGTILEQLRLKVSKIGLEKNITFLGEMSRLDVKNKMKEIDVFLLASTFETFGVVLIEALAAGVPVISTDSVGPRDIIDKSNGTLVTRFESEMYFKAMFEMTEGYSAYDKNSIRKDCFKRFSENTVMKQVEEVYINAISK